MRASKLPMLAGCRCFDPETTEENEWTFAGRERHEALWDYLRGDKDLYYLLPADDQVVVSDAAGYIKVHAPTLDNFQTETPTTITVDGMKIGCTPDLMEAPFVFDLKSREGIDYAPQMAAYAIACMDSEMMDWCEVHIGYTIPKFYARKLKFTLESAQKIIRDIVQAEEVETPFDHCHWCAKRLTCPALNRGALTVTKNREDWHLENYHPSQITNPAEMAKAKVIAYYLSKWCDSVDYHAKIMAIDKGTPIPGYHIQEGQDREIVNMAAAFDLLHRATGIGSKAFLDCCSLTKKALIESVARLNKTTNAQAERDIERALRSVTKYKPSRKLVKDRKKKGDSSGY